ASNPRTAAAQVAKDGERASGRVIPASLPRPRFWTILPPHPADVASILWDGGPPPMPHLLGIDIGTSGTKTLICDEKGKVLATAMAEHPISSPKPGWSEQNPEDWWKATCKATNAVMKRAKVRPTDIGGIGLSGQMHGSVFLPEASTKPLRPALLWNDQRTAKQCEEITAKAGGRKALIDLVANPALTGFTAPKILWVRENEPKVYEKTR